MDKLDLILQKINSFDARFDHLEEQMDAFDARLGRVEERLDRVEERLDRVEEHLVQVDNRLSQVETDVSTLKILIESKLVPSIQIIAEGHLDLSRKLDQALEDRRERECLWLRAVNLECEVKEIKKRQECMFL